MGRNGRTLAIPPHSGVGWSCARSGRPRPEARPTPQALRVACAPGGASAREGRPGARPAARPPPLLARPRLGPGPFSLLPERRALSHLRLPARPPRSARLAAGPDPPFRSHTQTLPLKEETLRHATSATPRMPSRTCHYLKSSCSFLSAPGVGEARAGTAVWRPTLHPPCPEQDRARGGAQ